MRVYRGIEQIPPDFGPSALTIGNFDGVHVGHRFLMRQTAQLAAEGGWKASVLTFDPHPAYIVAPSKAPRLMTAIARRCELMQEDGIEQVLVLPFTPEIARLTPEQFVEDLLVRRLGVKAVVVGEDFRFAAGQKGTAALLQSLGERLGFRVQLIESILVRGERVSSSQVRRHVELGEVGRAARLLSRPYSLEGAVVPGEGIGHRQTVPTLNLAPDSEVLPASGVYVTCTRDLETGRKWQSITNVGFRPTFNGQSLTIETFLLSALDPPSPRHIRVNFLWRVRDERKFDSPEALKAQILQDVARASAYFRHRDALVRVR
ncbi:MAG TPA: bifunctional riboflavin kinase/FAD synthetase [Solibacterales bacterium]|nr:bifunctional riboflavin kinase/FAD synthetase [Bryobacterales bacterium]